MMTPSAVRRLLGWGLFLAGTLLLIDAAVIRLGEATWQSRSREQSGAALPRAAGAASPLTPGAALPLTPGAASARAPDAPRPRPGGAMARIRLDRLGIDAMVGEGTDPRTLRLGPGHMQGSALPGEPDNCIIAGHRDGAFRGLRGVKAGDDVRLESAAGVNRYRVVDVKVVDKNNTDSLAPSSDPRLTLVTCYPFHYVGPAPKRLVVRAELMTP